MGFILRTFATWRMTVILVLGFSSGVPLALTGTTLQAWMQSKHVDLTTIGLFSLVGLPYILKFLWAPLMGYYTPLFLKGHFGWILSTQIALIISISCMGFTDPASLPMVTAIIAILVSFFSASQDIVVDAYRTNLATKEETGPAASLYIVGYRIAFIVSGGLALILADHLPWSTVYLIMAGTMSIGVLVTFFAPEPQTANISLENITNATTALILPFKNYFQRKGAWEILAFIFLYKIDVVIATTMSTPFLLEIGFSMTAIGTITKIFGSLATLVGALIGGTLVFRLGIKRSLWIFGISQGISGISFAVLAHLGHNYPMLITAITVENFCSAMGSAAFIAFLMSICDKKFSITQYALLSSLVGLSRIIGGAPTGYLAEMVSWESYFLISVLAMTPGLLLLTCYSKWSLSETPEKRFEIHLT